MTDGEVGAIVGGDRAGADARSLSLLPFLAAARLSPALRCRSEGDDVTTQVSVHIAGPVPTERDPEVEKAFEPLYKQVEEFRRAWAQKATTSGRKSSSSRNPTSAA